MNWIKMSTSGIPTIADKSITLSKLSDEVTNAMGSGGAITESSFPFFQNYSQNLYNSQTASIGKYVKADGTLQNYGGNLGLSDYIPVVAGDILYFNQGTWDSGFYDSSKVFKSIAKPTSPYTIPNDGTAFIRLAMPDYRSAMVFKNMPTGFINPYTYHPSNIYKLKREYGGSSLHGKIWVTEGDSITWGLYAEDPNNDGVANGDKRMPYTRLVAQRLGLLHFNYASSGATLSQQTGNTRTDAAVLRYPNYISNADIITVASGTNDGGIPMGTSTDTDVTTFYGALNTLLSGLINKYPGKKIGYIVPPQRKDTDISARVNAIKERCAVYSIPVLDLFNAGGLYPKIDAINNWYYANSGGTLGNTGDGLHPSYLGHQVIADKVEAFLKTL